jgi:lipopolysaccharide assembly outer membrane protein LptD (OstA)
MPAERDFETTIVYKAADSIRFNLRERQVIMYNKGSIDYGKISLKADHIEMDWNRSTVFAKGVFDTTSKVFNGTPIFKQEDETYDAKEIKYNFMTKRAIVKEVKTKQGEAFILGERIKREKSEDIFVKNAVYTTCNHAQPHFGIKATKIKMVGNREIITGPFFMTVEGVPTPLGFAFGLVPIPKKKTSGIIVPQYGEQRDRGFFLRDGGFYWATSEYIDFTFLGEIYSRGGWGLRTQSRYKKRYKFDGSFDLRYNRLPRGEKGTPTYNVEEGFWISWRHTPESRGPSRFSAQVNAGTTTFNARNSQNVNNYLSSSFTSSVNYSTNFKKLNVNTSVSLQHQQNVRTGVMTLSPRWAIGQNSRYMPFKNAKNPKNPLKQLGISYAFESKMDISNQLVPPTTQFKQPSDVKLQRPDTVGFNFANIARMLDYSKVGAKHSLKASTSTTVAKYFNISPYANYDEIWYRERYEYEWIAKDTVRTTVKPGFSRLFYFDFGTSVSTRIYSFYYFKSEKLKAIRHLMTPTLNFTMRPDFANPRWGFYQEVKNEETGTITRVPTMNGNFSTAPLGRSGTITFSLDNTLEAKVQKEEEEKAKNIKLLDNFGFSTAYNLAADSLKLSDLNFNLRTNLFQKVNVNVSTRVDPYTYLLLSRDSASGSVQQRKINQYAWNTGNGIGQISGLNLTFSTSIDPNTFKKKDSRPPAGANQNNNQNRSQQSKPEDDEQSAYVNENRKYYIDFKIPWRFNINANIGYQKQGFAKANITQTIDFNGEINITSKWKVSYRSGYDFSTKQLTFTSFDITRDLHCWSLSVNWVPFGPRQSYVVNLNVKAAVLQDLRLTRQNNWYDRR